jgi:hypothetical protein
MTSEVTESVLEGFHGTIFAYGQVPFTTPPPKAVII